MGNAVSFAVMSAGDFLNWEAAQAERHEFVDGEVYSMAGAEDRHVTLALNVAMALRLHLRGTPCRTYMSDMRLHVRASNSYFYPDVMVTCGSADRDSPLQKSEPQLVVEVLSPSTAAYDRGDKFARYRQIATLQEYMLVDPDSRRADVYRKGGDGFWVLHPFEAEQTVELACVNLRIGAAELFAEIDSPAG